MSIANYLVLFPDIPVPFSVFGNHYPDESISYTCYMTAQSNQQFYMYMEAKEKLCD